MVYLISILASGVTDGLGNPVSGGTVDFYDAGTTSRSTVYSDPSRSIALSNPSTLNSAGAVVAFATARVRLVIKDSSGVITQTLDNVGIGAKDITADDLANGSITTNTMADGSVSTTKITSLSASTRTFRNGQLALSKFSSINDLVSGTCGTFAPGTSLDDQDITNLNVTIVTTGRPVRVLLIPDGTANAGTIATITQSYYAKLLMDGSLVAYYQFGHTTASYRTVPSAIHFANQPAAGSHVYKFQTNTNAGYSWNNAKMFAYEL